MLIKDRENIKLISLEEFLEYLKQCKLGDMKARNIIIENNIGLVISIVNKRNINNNFDSEDMESIGFIALCNAVDTYDYNKNIAFSTYAYRCINNAILNYLRTLKKKSREVTLDNQIISVDDESEDIINKYFLSELITGLSHRDQEIIKLYYGFYNRRYSQKEISIIMNISISGISYIINKILLNMREKLLNSENHLTYVK